MSADVIRLRDYERKSRNPDAIDRDPTEADVIVLPVVRIEREHPGDIYDALAGPEFNWPMCSPY